MADHEHGLQWFSCGLGESQLNTTCKGALCECRFYSANTESDVQIRFNVRILCTSSGDRSVVASLVCLWGEPYNNVSWTGHTLLCNGGIEHGA